MVKFPPSCGMSNLFFVMRRASAYFCVAVNVSVLSPALTVITVFLSSYTSLAVAVKVTEALPFPSVGSIVSQSEEFDIVQLVLDSMSK